MNEHQRQRFAPALRRLSDDAELLQGMAALVVDDASRIVDRFEEAIQSRDFDDLAYAAHQLKGMLSTFETGPPVLYLQEIIDAARKGDDVSVRRRFDSIQPALRRLIDELVKLQNSP